MLHAVSAAAGNILPFVLFSAVFCCSFMQGSAFYTSFSRVPLFIYAGSAYNGRVLLFIYRFQTGFFGYHALSLTNRFLIL